MYLSLVSAVVYILFEKWYNYMLVNQVSILRFQEGIYNQCNGTRVHSKSINETLINVRNYMTYGSYLQSDTMRLFILIASLVLFAFHLLASISNCNKVTANFLSFFSGYKATECQENVENVPEQIPQDFQIELHEMIRPRNNDGFIQRIRTPTDSQNNIATTVIQILLSFLGLALVLFICYIPHLFYLYKIETTDLGNQSLLHKIIYISFDLEFFSVFLKLPKLCNFYFCSNEECFIFVSEPSWQCKSKSGHTCIFPFLTRDKFSYECEKLGKDDELRCPIGFDFVNGTKIGNVNNHNLCGPLCPGGK